MSSSLSEDQDQRSNAGQEDLMTMTIESLRARLLSERAISKTTKQTADKLAKRVLELEEQLKIVSLQRKRAEKATANVLAILESNGVNDASEEFDSNSDMETTISDCKLSNPTLKKKGASTDFEMRRHNVESYSSSEIDSSPSMDRSLSWKSGKDSPNYMDRKKFMDSGRRRSSSFASNSSLPRRVGKSCRRIRRRETRSMAEELQNDSSMHDNHNDRVVTCSQDVTNCPDNGPETLRDDPENHELENPQEAPSSGFSGTGVAEANVSSRNEPDKTRQRDLHDQAQEKAEDKAEEKDQREWEESFRENCSSVLDLCDPGNHSDVTEERDEMKAPSHGSPPGRINCLNQGTEGEVANTSSAEDHKPEVPIDFQAMQQVETRYSHSPTSSGMVTPESPSLGSAFPTSNGIHDKMSFGDPNSRPSQSSYMSLLADGSPGQPLSHVPLSYANNGGSSGRGKELALMPQNSSSNLDTVLEALQQAKLSIKDKLYSAPPSEAGSSVKGIEPFVPAARTRDAMEVPVGCPGLFRLPTDFQFERTTKANFLGLDSAVNLSSHCHETAYNRLISRPYMDGRSSVYMGELFCTSSSPPSMEMSGNHMGSSPFSEMHTSATPFPEHRPRIPTRRPLIEPPLDATFSGRTTYVDPRLSPGLPPSGNYTYPTYPVYPDMRPQLSSGERLPRNSSMEYGMLSSARFSLYDDHIRPNIYK